MLPQIPILLAACSSQSVLSGSSLKERDEVGNKRFVCKSFSLQAVCSMGSPVKIGRPAPACLCSLTAAAILWHFIPIFSVHWEPCCWEPCSLLFDFSPLKWPERQRAPSGDWLLAQHRLGVWTGKNSLPATLSSGYVCLKGQSLQLLIGATVVTSWTFLLGLVIVAPRLWRTAFLKNKDCWITKST